MPKQGVAEELGSGLLHSFPPVVKSGFLQEHVPGLQDVQAAQDQCQPRHLTFYTRCFFVVWGCPVRDRRFCSLLVLCSLDASSTSSLSCHNPRCPQPSPVSHQAQNRP